MQRSTSKKHSKHSNNSDQNNQKTFQNARSNNPAWTMRAVWLFFKMLQSFIGCVCLVVHIVGFLNVAVKQDLYLYMITFSTFTVISMFGCLSICLNVPRTAAKEVLLNAFASAVYLLTSLTTMYHAEKDLYLIYLQTSWTDIEEPEDDQVHPFFRWSKTQAIAAVANSALHLLHSVLTFDVVCTDYQIKRDIDKDEDDDVAKVKLQLYVGGRQMHTYLLKYKWFRRLEDKTRPGDWD